MSETYITEMTQQSTKGTTAMVVVDVSSPGSGDILATNPASIFLFG